MDYRYFPEPDLPPLSLTPQYIAARVTNEVPMDRRIKYLDLFKLSADDARILSQDRELSDYFEYIVSATEDPKRACSYITTILFGLFIERELPIDLASLKFPPSELVQVIKLV